MLVGIKTFDSRTIPYAMKFREITRLPRRMLWALVMEGVETTRMVQVFVWQGTRKLGLTPAHHQPTPEQIKEAMDQLKDIPRFLPFFMVVIVPLPGVTEGYAIVAMTVEKWLGHKVRLLPSRFRDVLEPVEKVEKESVDSK